MTSFVRALLLSVLAPAVLAIPVVDPATEGSPFTVVIGADKLWSKRWTVITGNEVRLTQQTSTSSRAIIFTATSPGLSGEDGTISIEWQGRPGFYLSNVNGKIWLQPLTTTNKATFNRDATFHLRDALSGNLEELSLECGLNSGQYVVHSNEVLEVAHVDTGSSDARSRASFFTAKYEDLPTLPMPVVVRSENFPEYAWDRPSSGGWMSDADRSDIVKLEQGNGAEFLVHSPGLKGCDSESGNAVLRCVMMRQDTVSFEFANIPPGAFLRQSEGRALVGQRSGGNFEEDATFLRVTALSGTAGYASFESVKHPGHYIVHNNYQLLVAPVSRFDSTELLRKDASFKYEQRS